MSFSDIIQKVNSDKRLIPDLMKSENGNNFRAISESAILDVINPILEEEHIFYTVAVKDLRLEIKEAFTTKGKKLQFIATIVIKLILHHQEAYRLDEDTIETESVGMGIDDNDKAVGKAYTYAIKYALLKLFRLRYGDDPDAKASEPLMSEKFEKQEEKKSAPEKPKSKSSEPLMSEKQLDYILGMMKSKNVPESKIIGKFHVEPSIDKDITMKQARAIIKWLEDLKEGTAMPEDDDLPF